MPRKSKRQRQLAENLDKARDALRSPRIDHEQSRIDISEDTSTAPFLNPDASSEVSMSTSDEDFDPEVSLKSDLPQKHEIFAEEWVLSLDHEEKKSLALFLDYYFKNLLNFTAVSSAEHIAIMMGRSERTIRDWISKYFENEAEIPDSKQGRYQRRGLLWSNETLNRKATVYVRESANIKGKPNMTAGSFCQWVNEELLPNECLEPGFPRKISVETARQWLHALGFTVLVASKGAYYDGHERPDVAEYRKDFLKEMVKCGFVHPDQAPNDEAQRAFPKDIDLVSSEQREKTVLIFHDESTFHANEDQTTQWGVKGEGMLRPKSKGSGIMVSDFVDEHTGYLQLSDNEFDAASKEDITIPQKAREFLEIGESREGYWDCDKFMLQMNNAVKIADIKYPKSQRWNVIWIFDHSSCHTAMAKDALNADAMNLKPGGKQPVMRDTIWQGKVQKMNFNLGVPKGMKQVLSERGYDVTGMKADKMREILKSHEDFKNEKPRVIRFLEEKSHVTLFLPKFHPELNPIERVWGQAKRYTKAHCNYSFPALRKTIPTALDSVNLDLIKKYTNKSRSYMFAYFEGYTAGPKLEERVKKYKSHRRVGIND